MNNDYCPRSLPGQISSVYWLADEEQVMAWIPLAIWSSYEARREVSGRLAFWLTNAPWDGGNISISVLLWGDSNELFGAQFVFQVGIVDGRGYESGYPEGRLQCDHGDQQLPCAGANVAADNTCIQKIFELVDYD